MQIIKTPNETDLKDKETLTGNPEVWQSPGIGLVRIQTPLFCDSL